MKLSSAIRTGAKTTAPLRTDLFKFKDGKVVAACALGASYLARCGVPDLKDESGYYTYLLNAFPVLDKEVPHPVFKNFSDRVIAVIYTLNDSSGWTRERIADWVERYE